MAHSIPAVTELPLGFTVADPSKLRGYETLLDGDLHRHLFGESRRKHFVELTKAVRFHPPLPTDTPEQLFTHSAAEHNIPKCHPTAHRFVRRSDPTQFMIYTDGSCLGNGTPVARAGCAFVYKPSPYGAVERSCAFPLELEGPTGKAYHQTSSRAELRSVIAALQFRHWMGEGWKSLIIATDSAYVVTGITEHIEIWQDRAWLTSKGVPVKNRDLWEALLTEVNRHAGMGMDVLFWQIPRRFNYEADRMANSVAEKSPPTNFRKEFGVLV